MSIMTFILSIVIVALICGLYQTMKELDRMTGERNRFHKIVVAARVHSEHVTTNTLATLKKVIREELW